MVNPANILGVVLTGGRSTRMGRDKGLLPVRDVLEREDRPGETWSERACALFEELGLPAVLSVNPDQRPEYERLFAADALMEDNPAFTNAHGPLRGILSVAERFPGRDLFVLACDLPHMTTSVMQQILEAASSIGDSEFVAYNNPVGERGGIEPLCSLYTGPALRRLCAQYADTAGGSTDHLVHCPRKLLSTGRTVLLHAEADARAALRNLNSEADLRAAAEHSS